MAVEDSEVAVQALLSRLKNPATSLSEKYRILFSLRNLPGSTSHNALLEGKHSRGKKPTHLPHSC